MLRASIVVVLSLFSPAVASAQRGATSDERRVLLSLDGLWEGVLEYRDYQSDQVVEIPARVECEASRIGPVLARTITFTDPGRVISMPGVITLAGGEYTDTSIGDGDPASYRVVNSRFEDTYDWAMTLAGEGTDDGVASEIRIEQVLDGESFTSTQRVRPAGKDDAEWLVRNEIRLRRVPADTEALLGRWEIDLRPAAGAEPYAIAMEITSVSEGSVAGTFYGGTTIGAGGVSGDWGAVRFSFSTADGSGTYLTSGTLRGGVLRGTTWSPGRGFLMRWTGTRAADPDPAD